MRGSARYWLAAVFVVLTFGVAGNSVAAEEPRPESANTGASSHPHAPAADRRAAERVAKKFVARSNAGDTAGVAALIAEDVKWDTVGTVFNGRTAVMDELIVPFVINTGGQYRTEAVHWDTYRLQVDYNFTSDTGEDLGLHYAYLVEDGLIRDIVEYINYVN